MITLKPIFLLDNSSNTLLKFSSLSNKNIGLRVRTII